MNDFNKLDKFMRQHIPEASQTLVQPHIPQAARSWMPAFLTIAAAILILLTLNFRMDSHEEDTLATLRALDWDESVNDLPADVADLVSIVD